MADPTMPETWGTVFRRYKERGHDPSDAAHRADLWQQRKLNDPGRWARCPSTHCERRQECASPHECCAALRRHLEDKP